MTTEDNSEHDATVVDWEAARTFTGGDDALLMELIDLFPEESAKQLEAMQAAIDEVDGPSLTRAAHTLKSSARLFGATTLIAQAAEMEKLGQASSVEAAQGLLRDLQAETGRVTAALQRGAPGREQGGMP